MRKTAFAPGEWYHCYNRGVDKRILFKNTSDYQRFVMLLYASNGTRPVTLKDIGKNSQGPSLGLVVEVERGEQLVDVGAYALMPNHYHLLIRECVEGGLTTFMRKLGTGYAMSFNLKYQRVGTLFSSRFQARHVDEDSYMRRLVHYIHGNPAELFEPGFKEGLIRNRKELERKLLAYSHSSLFDYQKSADRLEKVILNQKALRDAVDIDFSFPSMLKDALDFVRANPEVRPWD
jgi:putative transposase